MSNHPCVKSYANTRVENVAGEGFEANYEVRKVIRLCLVARDQSLPVGDLEDYVSELRWGTQ